MVSESLYTDRLPRGEVKNVDDRPYDPNKARISDIVWYNLDWLQNLEKAGYFKRPAIMDNINKSLLCNTEYLGYDAFECPKCGNGNLVFHKCHSRFCNSCGVKEQKLLAAKVAEMAIDAPHRHIVFTIPFELRSWFREDRDALSLLFVAARNTICCIINERIYRRLKRSFTPYSDTYYLYQNFRHQKDFGMIACLHTFGRDIKWNPHIHALVPELIYDPDTDSVKSFTHFDFKKLRLTFQYELLRLMSERFGDAFKAVKNQIYHTKKNAFYVYARYTKYDLSETGGREIDNIRNVKDRVNYIMRYAARPAMAESRIVSFDKATNMVHWFYHRHEDNVRVDITESGRSFLKRLLIHIPDNGFPMVRYYGFYSNREHKTLDRIYALLSQKKHTRLKTLKQRKHLARIRSMKFRYRTFVMDSYNRDVLLCPCGTIMEFVGCYNPLKGISNDDRYRRDCINEMRDMWLRRRSTGMGPPGNGRS